ncbi:MAG: ABC transporter substrate-binding protein [Thermodesulfobacteriota bacterium]
MHQHSSTSFGMIKKLRPIIFLLLGFFVVPTAAPAAELEQMKASLILQWSPQAQFAGYFVAEEKGFYRARGLDLTILPGGPDRIVSDYLATGRADFGSLFLATALERRDAGIPLVNVGQFIHHSSLMLVTRSGDMTEIKDLDGKKVSLWANEFQIQPRLLFEETGIDVKVVFLEQSMDLFLRGAVSATSAMWYNEYHSILSAGLRREELQTFFFKDTPFDFPEDGIYCLETTLQKKPEAAAALIDATREGWQYAFDHPEETLDIVARRMAEANLPVSRAHQRWMLVRMKDVLAVALQQDLGTTLEQKTFEKVVSHLLSQGVIYDPVEYDDFYRGAR